MVEEKIIKINNLQYCVYDFLYVTGFMSGEERFILIRNNNIKKKCKKGEIYILIPSWVEMQDIYQSSSERNIMTKKYELNYSKLKMNKIAHLCRKVIDGDGVVHIFTKKMISKMNVSFAQFVLTKIDDIIDKYYVGTGLTHAEEKELSHECYKYYNAIYKNRSGKIVQIPPCPAPVILLDVCDRFSCTPDIARNISKQDIDMMMIAKEQENICKNPYLIGGSGNIMG